MLSKGILIFAIHRNRSAEGVSLITQGLYAVVFCTRYLDLFREQSAWNAIFKVTYIVTSFYILAVMQWLFPRSREREISWKLGAIVLGGSLALSPFAMLIFESRSRWGFLTVCFPTPLFCESGGRTRALTGFISGCGFSPKSSNPYAFCPSCCC